MNYPTPQFCHVGGKMVRHVRFAPDNIKTHPNTSRECQILSTTMHIYCATSDNCECGCHEKGMRSNNNRVRPHSYPRKDWEMKKVAGYYESIKRGEPLIRKSRELSKQEGRVEEMLKDVGIRVASW